MMAKLYRYGDVDYDFSLKGADVLGFSGDFSKPFISVGDENVIPRVYFEFFTNCPPSRRITPPKLSNVKLNYRWRYLNQVVKPWQSVSFTPNSTTVECDLVAQSNVPVNDGAGDLEYFYSADLDAMYYQPQDFAYSPTAPVGWGTGWTEGTTAITNRATYTAADGLPSGGTDYFVRIREGESNIEWVQLVGKLIVTNAATGTMVEKDLLVPGSKTESPRMTLVGNHSWRYHYQIPTNEIGGKLEFHLVTKEYYTNATDATEWFVRTNRLYTVEDTVTDIPFTATLHDGFDGTPTNEISVILDNAATHLKIEYNDEQRAFSLSHAAYQDFNQWTDAKDAFRGNVMETNGNAVVSNSGVSGDKGRFDAPFDNTWELCPETRDSLWTENFTPPSQTNTVQVDYPLDTWFSVLGTPNGWTGHNGRFVLGERANNVSIPLTSLDRALALDGLGEGALAIENFTAGELPLGLDTVEFTARIAQPIQFEDFATYLDGVSCTNYAISAKVTMSQEYESSDRTHKPSDMSPIHPSISLVGYHRHQQGCYEFRMTRRTDLELELALYKWARSGSTTKPTLLTSKRYTTNLLVPSSAAEASGSYWTSAYFLVYTLPAGGGVKLEGHLAPKRTNRGVYTDANTSDTAALKDSVISFTDTNPGLLARGGTYGVGSTDCCAGFGEIGINTVSRPPSETADAVINFPSTFEGATRLGEEWGYYESRWEVDHKSYYASSGGLLAVIPSNQVIEVWLSDAERSGSGWIYSGYSTTVNSFSTNKFSVSPHMPGTWKVRLQTGLEEDAGVVVDDVSITPWEGVETWGRTGSAYDENSVTNWVYTKAWVTASADVKYKGKPYVIPSKNILPVGTNGYVFVFNEPGEYEFTPSTDMEIDRVLVVGGGGSGGSAMGGGGGGGGVVEVAWTNNTVLVPKGTRVTITVGAGGAAPVPVYSSGKDNATSQPAGKTGGDSKLSGLPNVTVATAKGGGGGSGWSEAAKSGGSGGGGAGSRAGAAGTNGQGNQGGTATKDDNKYGLGGGGGGGGGVGQDGVATNSTDLIGGKGGDGWASDITGRLCYYGGGGGGGVGWKNSAVGGAGGKCGPADDEMTAGHGASYQQEAATLTAGLDGYGGGGGGGTYYNNSSDANVKKGAGAAGGCGTVILRVRTASVVCDLQPSRGKADYPMGLRTPFIDEGMSLFTYSYANADSNCVLLVQISTNLMPNQAGAYVPQLTESLVTNGENRVWTTIARHDFSTVPANELAKGTKTAFISLRQHTIRNNSTGQDVYTNVCGVIRVIVDPAIVSRVVNIPSTNIVERKAFENYGRITLTKAYCYNEPPLDMRSWFGWNVYTDGWDGEGNAGRFAYLTDWPDGLSIALNFSAKALDNLTTEQSTLGIGLAEPDREKEYAGQNPFIQSAALTNGIGTVSFRARLFDTNAPRAVVTLYGSEDAAADQPTTELNSWHILTNFVVTSPTYQAFEWNYPGVESRYQAVRLEAAGARWGRRPTGVAEKGAWEWDAISDKEEPINRVFIDEVSVSELIVPRLKFLDVRPFRTNLGTESICVITNIMSSDQQPLANESWGVQCRIEPQQMADELDLSSIRVWLDVYRGGRPWGYEQWKNAPETTVLNGRTIRQRFSSQLQQISTSNLIFRSYYELPDSIIPPEEEANTVYQYSVRVTYRDKSGKEGEYTNVLSSVDWIMPEWYQGSNVGAGNESGDPDQFSAFTILDEISPRRAWINELNLCDAQNGFGLYQFIELAVPSGANIEGWKILFLQSEEQLSAMAPLVTLGVDEGVQGLKSKTGVYDYNKYTFVSICSPKAKENVRNDGYWKSRWATSSSTNGVTDGVFSYQRPYGLRLVRPSGIIEHEIVMDGTNKLASLSARYSGTNLTAQLQRQDPNWLYVGVDHPYDNTSLGVMANHGEVASDWENVMACTPGERNRRKNGTYQTIPSDYYIEPLGGIICIESRLLQPQYSKQFFGGNDMGASAKIAVTADITTNIVFMVTNWYQLGVCTIDGKEAPAMRGKTGTYTLTLGPITNTVKLVIDVEPDDKLKDNWGLSENNSYSAAVLEWLKAKYMDYTPSDISQAIYRDLSGTSKIPLTLTEMYWLDIPPVHEPPHYGGSNIWFVAGMGAQVSNTDPDVEPYVKTRADGTSITNIFMTVTMMITNTSPLATRKVWPPDRLNGHEYVDGGSSAWEDRSAWTSAVFMVVGALQRPGYTSNFYPLQQYFFKPNSFGAADDPQHAFQTRIEVTDPYDSDSMSMGNSYDWPRYRGIYPIFYRWAIKGAPDKRISIVPLYPKWTSP